MNRIYDPVVLSGWGRARELFDKADVVQELNDLLLMGINRAGWPRQVLGHALYTQPDHRPPRDTSSTNKTCFKVTLTKKPNSLYISPWRHCVDVRFRRLLDGVWSSMLSVNLEAGPIKQTWIWLYDTLTAMSLGRVHLVMHSFFPTITHGLGMTFSNRNAISYWSRALERKCIWIQ